MQRICRDFSYNIHDNEIRVSGAQRVDALAWGARELRVEGLALPKSVESGNLSLNEVGIRWMSASMCVTMEHASCLSRGYQNESCSPCGGGNFCSSLSHGCAG